MANSNLHQAKRQKKDEFYTQLSDIEKELKHYGEHFKGKVVYCNCDDPSVSKFFHYFTYNFEKLGLRKLITTCYRNQQVDMFSQNDAEAAICLEYAGDKNGNRVPDLDEIGVRYLEGDGDFRSEECIELLKQADVVVTNPPFSLFREYVAQLVEHGKEFLIIGNMNAITYKEVFKLIKDGKLWLGHTHPKVFLQPDGSEKKFGNICWFTNLPTERRAEDLILYKTYYGHEAEYPYYDNYDAIEVSKVKNIPIDYEGVMGVPITFLDKYNPEQAEILGIANSARWIGHECLTIIQGRKIYNRILIKNRFEIVGNAGSYAPDGYSLASELFIDGDKKFKRILIRKKAEQ